MKPEIKPEMKPMHPQSLFIFDAFKMEVVWGKAPTKDGQLWCGEDTHGKKMQLAGVTGEDPVAYWGW